MSSILLNYHQIINKNIKIGIDNAIEVEYNSINR